MTAHPDSQSMIRAALFGYNRSELITGASHAGPDTSSIPVTSGADERGASRDMRGDEGEVSGEDVVASVATGSERSPPGRTSATTPTPTTSTAASAARTAISVLETASLGSPVIARLLHARSHTHCEDALTI
ncbi:hypothetical protein G6014_03675 [Dietzia kunjamensis]|uniref:hypothetical protein n=1 Tax=Dietzia kunjamensis TaxID=322509 RepID=UPI000E764068|nr:hypothetical protein [Dietzia kunjamensis]MBB1011388.1 hypothetical protein [Dietzia kunjamensis]MVZ91135.1 hypothetical protein [Microbacter sp. ANSKLAB05]